jgi:hypothetical protein
LARNHYPRRGDDKREHNAENGHSQIRQEIGATLARRCPVCPALA